MAQGNKKMKAPQMFTVLVKGKIQPEDAQSVVDLLTSEGYTIIEFSKDSVSYMLTEHLKIAS